MTAPAQLAATLRDLTEPEYVRFVAQWIDQASQIDDEPPMTGDDVIDAIVAAAAGYVGLRRYGTEPRWTSRPARFLHRSWHPGPAGMFAYSRVHAPASFVVRGIVVEEDSLRSV